jgi:hypothetical protein
MYVVDVKTTSVMLVVALVVCVRRCCYCAGLMSIRNFRIWVVLLTLLLE